MFYITHTDGSGSDSEDVAKLYELYDELKTADIEHAEVSVSTKDGWYLSAFQSGRIILGNVHTESQIGAKLGARHMESFPKERVVELWQKLSSGELDLLDREPWKPGYYQD